MNPLSIYLVGRFSERISCVLIAGLLICLGWSLFKSPLPNDGAVEYTQGKLRLILRRIGPGTFFSLFGSAILGISLLSPITFKIDKPIDSSRPEASIPINNGETIVVGGASDDYAQSDLEMAQILNTTLSLTDDAAKDPHVLQARISNLASAKSLITQARNRILVKHLGTDRMNLWNTYKDSPVQLDTDERKKLDDTRVWYDTVTQK